MNNPTSIQKFKDALKVRQPEADVQVDVPQDPDGLWWLDIHEKDLTIAWKPGLGFGVFLPGEQGYGALPNETYQDPEETAARVAQLYGET